MEIFDFFVFLRSTSIQYIITREDYVAAGVVRKDVWRGNAGIDASLFLIMRVFIYINSSSQQKDTWQKFYCRVQRQ